LPPNTGNVPIVDVRVHDTSNLTPVTVYDCGGGATAWDCDTPADVRTINPGQTYYWWGR